MYPITMINEELFNAYSLTSKNLDRNKIKPFIYLAQESFVKPTIGKALYEEIQNEISSGNISDSNKILLNELAQPLALYTDYLSLRTLAYQITAKGITKEASENSSTIEFGELGAFKLDIQQQFELAKASFEIFLCANSEIYPLFDIKLCEKVNQPVVNSKLLIGFGSGNY